MSIQYMALELAVLKTFLFYLITQCPLGIPFYFPQTHHKIQCGLTMGRGVVSVLAFYSNNPSSNSSKVYSFSVNFILHKQRE